MDYSSIKFCPSPGGLEDSTTHTVNGSCYSIGNINPGVFVSVVDVENGYKGVAPSNKNILGVSFNESCKYYDGDPIPIVSKGKVFVITNIADVPDPLSQVFADENGLASLTGEPVRMCLFTGAFYRIDHEIAIVGIQLP